MNNYLYEDIEPGKTEKFTATVSEADMDSFRSITGDINKLHMDDDFAKGKGYQNHVVFGMLTASYYSTLAGVYLPGERSLIHSLEVKFMKPVYVGDQLTIQGQVLEKNDLFKFIKIKASIINQDQIKVSRAIIVVGVI